VPVAAGIFAVLSKVAEGIGDSGVADALRISQQGLAFYVDAATFLFSAAVIARLPLPKRERPKSENGDGKRIDWGQAFSELKEGWQFIFVNPVVRAVNVGLATGLIGGGMLVPLGPVFSNEVLGSGDDGFGFFIFALGVGVAIGVVLLSIFQKRLPKPEVFAGSVFVAGVSLLGAASMSTLLPAALFVTFVGVCAGSVYVLGFTLLHESVDDDLRGRIFGALYILIRFCVLLAFAVGPLLADLLDRLSNSLVDRELSFLGVQVAIPGVRLTLWLAGLIIMSAGVLAVRSLRTPEKGARPQWIGAEIVAGFTNPISEVKRSHDHPSLRSEDPP
jgi:hypothetical protein